MAHRAFLGGGVEGKEGEGEGEEDGDGDGEGRREREREGEGRENKLSDVDVFPYKHTNPIGSRPYS